MISRFRYADYGDVTLPWMRGWSGLHLLPSRAFLLWRGGRGAPAEIANSNMSWSLSRPAAAWFALLTVRSPDDALRPPVLLRRRATRDQALAYFATREREVVMPDPGPYTLETPGSAALERLAGTLREGPVHGRFGDLGREESWQGWTG